MYRALYSMCELLVNNELAWLRHWESSRVRWEQKDRPCGWVQLITCTALHFPWSKAKGLTRASEPLPEVLPHHLSDLLAVTNTQPWALPEAMLSLTDILPSDTWGPYFFTSSKFSLNFYPAYPVHELYPALPILTAEDSNSCDSALLCLISTFLSHMIRSLLPLFYLLLICLLHWSVSSYTVGPQLTFVDWILPFIYI